MKIYFRHPWKVSYRQALRIQERLNPKVSLKNSFKTIKRVAGCDLAFSKNGKLAVGGVIVYSWPELEEIERRHAVYGTIFPYIPGLLSFREAPVLLRAIAKLKHAPDLYLFDGQGIAHPRGAGLATHMGILLNKPSIGCAKSRLFGTHAEPGREAGCSEPLYGKKKQTIGRVVRTKDGVRPVFVSPGHKIDLKTAVSMVLTCTDGYRIPKPIREADHFVEKIKRTVA